MVPPIWKLPGRAQNPCPVSRLFYICLQRNARGTRESCCARNSRDGVTVVPLEVQGNENRDACSRGVFRGYSGAGASLLRGGVGWQEIDQARRNDHQGRVDQSSHLDVSGRKRRLWKRGEVAVRRRRS